jgi:hypothetical protein
MNLVAISEVIGSGTTALKIDGGNTFSGTGTQTNVNLGGGVYGIRVSGEIDVQLPAAVTSGWTTGSTCAIAMYMNVESFNAGAGGLTNVCSIGDATNDSRFSFGASSASDWRPRNAGTTVGTGTSVTANTGTYTIVLHVEQGASDKTFRLYKTGSVTDFETLASTTTSFSCNYAGVDADATRISPVVIGVAYLNNITTTEAAAIAEDFNGQLRSSGVSFEANAASFAFSGQAADFVALMNSTFEANAATFNFTGQTADYALVSDPYVTTGPIMDAQGNLRPNETGVTVCLYNASTHALVVAITGQTTDSSANCTYSSASLSSATAYRERFIFDDGTDDLPEVTTS